MPITQRHATLGILCVHTSGAVLFCLVGLVTHEDRVLTVASGLSALLTAVLLACAWYDWPIARYLEIMVTTVLIGALIPNPAHTPQMDTAIFIVPVLALILGDPRWVIGSVATLLAILLLRTRGQGVYADPESLIVYGVSVGGMVVARVVLTTAQQLAETNAHRAETRAGELSQRNTELTTLNQLSVHLQACTAIPDATQILLAAIQRLFPVSSGALYMQEVPTGAARMLGHWGTDPSALAVLHLARCQALRGQVVGPDAVCCQVHAERGAPTLRCIPLMAQGETFGLLHIRVPASTLTAVQEQLLTTMVDQGALALANIRLRERLEQQAIRDPLTGLFNRRYMEVSFERELHRAQRNQTGLSVLLMDLDHFKQINDTFGHATGDLVLRELGMMLRTRTRANDIVCRYGGEEILVIMPETGLPVARERAEQLRQAMRELPLQAEHGPVRSVTISIGVAVFPDHGETSDALLQAADTALYRAKATGRNRVCLAHHERADTRTSGEA